MEGLVPRTVISWVEVVSLNFPGLCQSDCGAETQETLGACHLLMFASTGAVPGFECAVLGYRRSLLWSQRVTLVQ